MSNYASLKSAIQQVIKTNGNNEITGALLQQSLLSMINSLGVGYQFVGIATPSTNPGTPDARVMYLAYLPGTYVNFGGLAVTGFCVLKYNTAWTKEDIPISGSAGGDTDFLTEPDDLTLEAAGDTKILKFANRSYNSDNPNGMGYKILRADKTFAEQVTLANTIYEIRYNFDLGGASVTIPAGCVLKFVGGSLTNGSVIFNKTTFEGLPKIACEISGTLDMGEIDVTWFAVDNSGNTDATERLRSVIKLAYDSASIYPQSYPGATKLRFPKGTYVVSDSLIDNKLGVTGGKFIFCGDGAYNTTIMYSGSNPLFDNIAIFGFTSFIDIGFWGNNSNKFLYFSAGPPSQFLTFVRCYFHYFITIIQTYGNSMCSEVTFDACKIAGCGNENLNIYSNLFIFENPQGVNWRFVNTDIESIYGTIFQYKKGTCITFFQGSIIPISSNSKAPSVVFEIPVVTNPGTHQGGSLLFLGTRFELRGYSLLYRCLSNVVGNIVSFYGCGLGGYNLTDDTSFYCIQSTGYCKIDFYGCTGFIKYGYSHSANNGSIDIALIRCDDPKFIEQLITHCSDSRNTNLGNNLYIQNTITGEKVTSADASDQIRKNFSSTHPMPGVTEAIALTIERNGLWFFKASGEDKLLNKKCTITGLSIMNFATPGYGDAYISITATLINYDGTDGLVVINNASFRQDRNARMCAVIPGPIQISGIRFHVSSNYYQNITILERGFIELNYF